MAQSSESDDGNNNNLNNNNNSYDVFDDNLNNFNNNKSLSCRMYENEYPNVDDLVVVQVKSIADMGAYCALLEYNNIEGMILMSELSRRRIRSVNRVIRVGRMEIVSVLHVNKEKGYIDLSKKRVSPDEVQKVEERWNKSKAVHSIMRHIAKESQYGVEELYQHFGWPMAKRFKHVYDGFKWALQNRDQFLKDYDVPKDILDILFKNIENRLRPQVVTIRASIECTCFTKEGIEAIKRALKAGLDEQEEDTAIKINLVAPPLFNVSLSTLNPEDGRNKINHVIEIIENNIKKSGGNLVIKSQPAAVIPDELNKQSITQ